MLTGLAIYLAPIIAAAIAFHIGVWWLVRWARAKEAGTSLVLAIVPFTSDVAATERALPDMRRSA